MKINIIEARSDLGVHVDGSNLGAQELNKELNLNSFIINKDNIEKSKSHTDLRKNEESINHFTKKVFDTTLSILEKNEIPLLIGGDHSCVIGSALASQKYNKNIGIIWIDAHGDYNTFETTKSGNIHGLPLAAITGYKCEELTNFITDNHINPKNCVVVGARSIDPWEIGNMIDAEVTIFTTEDIKNEGASNIMKKAISIASNNTNGIHISYDLDVIDPNIAPGVSVPEENGINEKEAYEIMNEIINNKNIIKSMDLVEFNPTLDIDDKTKKIALNLLKQFME
ncbi:MAG: arginase [Bacilli bacterium]|nr:arginase [Bacilli bacterium]